MFEALVEAVQDSVKTEVVEIGGENFVTRPVYRVPDEDIENINALKINTLAGVVDYLQKNANQIDGHATEKLIIHVANARKVAVYSQLDKRRRDCFLLAELPNKSFSFDSYQEIEQFIVELQTRFAKTPDSEKITQIVGNLTEEDVKTLADDGFSQGVTVKTGIVKREDVKVKNPFTLQPFRTFLEVEQPESDFIFRLRQRVGSLPQVALFEADGGKWELEAIAKIKAYLKDKLPDIPIVA